MKLTTRIVLKRSILVLFFTFVTIGCSTNSESKHDVVIVKYATHPALDEVEENFINTLAFLRQDVNIIRLNAHGDPAKAKQLAESYTKPSTKLFVSLATPATQAVSNTTSGIPLLFGAVSDPIGANIDMKRSTGITNVDINIIKKSIATIMDMYPNTHTIGTVYNPVEQNSIFVQQLIQEACDEKKLTLIQRAVSSPTQFQTIIEILSAEVDVLYCANDNLVNKAVTSISRTSAALNLPFFIGELSAVSSGPLAGIGVEYSGVGKRLSVLADIILTNIQSESLPKLEGPSNVAFWLNTKTAEEIGFGIDSNIVLLADSLLK